MLTMEITRLIERCRQGDADALGELYKAYAPQMRGVCRRYFHDEQMVEDVLHDAFIIIFTSFDRLRDERRAEAWMMAITRNVASKCKEHLEALPTVSLDETSEAEQITTEDEERDVKGVPLSEVIKMIDRLPEGYGKVFRLSVLEGMSHKEIAEMLGIEPHSSSSQLARAKKMLRKMMRQYSAVLFLILASLLFFPLRKGEKVVKEEIPVLVKQQEESEEKPLERKQEPLTDHSSDLRVSIFDAVDTLQSIISQATDSIPQDTLSNMMVQEQIITDTLAMDKSKTLHKEKLPYSDNFNIYPRRSRNRNNWHIALTYAGIPQHDRMRTDNYMTMPSFSGSKTRSAKLYNWGDYMDYAIANAPMMDSVSASNMTRVAIINSNNPLEPLVETKHHERPLTIRLSLSRRISNRWSLATGLNYSYMKSTFESGNENTSIHRTQRLQYIGIPLKFDYRIAGNNRWSLYTTGGIELDIPVSARISTRYIYNGTNDPLKESPNITTRIRAPWQWSVNTGIGTQYQIVPHLDLYLEPSLNYYIPTSNAIETYRSEHPLIFSLPFGIRLSW